MSIKLYNLITREEIFERVPAEAFMRFLYGNPAGSLALWALFKRALFSKICGAWASSPSSRRAIAAFIEKNGIDMSDVPQSSFKNFNEFFTRALKPGARAPQEPLNENAISFPSDGRHLLVRDVRSCDVFYAKGSKFNISAFLGDKSLAETFDGADMLISRLAPVDYHRFHFPMSGEIAARKSIAGDLYSVSPIALSGRLSILWQNKRVLNMVQTPKFGFYAFVEIGATNVGGIVNTRRVGDFVARGDEAGYFNFGGSCIITIFPKRKIIWDQSLEKMSSSGIECYAKAGMKAGEFA